VEMSLESVLLEFVGSRAERVGLDDVGAGANVFGVYLADQIGRAEVQLVVTAINVDALGVEHRTHRAVDYEDTVSGK